MDANQPKKNYKKNFDLRYQDGVYQVCNFIELLPGGVSGQQRKPSQVALQKPGKKI